jgi:hypothetical protein
MARDERMNIFNQVRAGELSLEEADRLLQSLDEQTRSNPAAEAPAAESSAAEQPAADVITGLGWWENAWLIPVWVGIGIIVFSALLINWGYTNERFFWFYCSWLPLALGILVLILGVWSQQARWVHLRIQDAGSPKISFSLPLPIRLASWALRVFGPRIPGLKEKHLDQLPEILDAIGDSRDPITVEVDDGDDHVRVYIL